MLINIRGTNGSGKTTIIRALMDAARSQTRIYGRLGIRSPEAYQLIIPSVAAPVFILGPYVIESGGCDSVQPYDLILDLIEAYQPRGHVVFEGVLVSSSYGRVGRLLERWGQDSVMAFLDTTLEQCIKNVQARRDRRGDGRPFNPHNLTTKFNQIQGSKEKIRAENKVRVEELSSLEGHKKVLKWLRAAK